MLTDITWKRAVVRGPPRARVAPRWVIGLVAASVLPAARADEGYVAAPALRFAAAIDSPLHMPTDVAVTPDGRVVVVDGVNDRLVVFAPGGELLGEIRGPAGDPMRQPIGIGVGAEGRLWVADTGNRRVLVFAADGVLVQRIPMPADEAAHAPDVTDVAVAPDGASAWAVNNDGDRLLRYDVASGSWQPFGGSGESLGQFRYPFQIATARNGDLAVTDVINSRGQVLSSGGAPIASVGTYGVQPGELYRPTGVAVDAPGNIWIADSVTGVVQIFRPNGVFLGVLQDADGNPLRVASPMGMAFDDAGDLYVVELRGDRVQKLRIARPSRPVEPDPIRRRAAGTGREGRACTICHLDWLPPFSEGRDSGLMPMPTSTPEDPYVARGEVCLSCHDGSVADSRHRVWQEHGHRTNVLPPETMQVPPNLPLVNGRLACRTCHSAHGTEPPQGDIARAMLLRVKNTAGELCISCHTDKTRGPEFGTHPTGGMPWPIPQALVEAGAKVGPNPRELTCQVCHTPHGARFDHLLVMGTNSNQLCLTCHDQMRPGMFREGGPREHPLSPKVNAEQAAAIANMGTKLGPEGELICLSCHKLHHGFGQRFMLADDLAEGQMCLRCHSARAEMIGSAHDLRTNAPQERNRLGMTPMTGGPCSSCHLFHRYARELASTPLDRSGECVTCHQPGRCAERKVLASPNHPVDQCTDCHNPHETRYGSFLKQRTPDVCESCHSEKSSVLGSAHDASGDPAAWAGSGTYAADACLACHRPHGDPEHGLFRAAPSASGAGADAPCLACHSEAEWNGPGPIAALHTTDAPADRSALTLPLNDAPTLLAPRIGCRTCHDPHGGDGAMPLLRASSEAGGAGLCTTCHTAMASIVLTAHAPDRLAAAGFEARACGPCHLAHGDPCEVNPRLLWPIALAGAPIAADATRVTDPCCVGCHSPDGAAPAPAIATHPDVPMFSPAVADSPSALPLFAADGTRDAQGQIACRTCHLPHGRPELARVADAAPPAALRAMRPQLRSFEPPNACTNCHSTEALRRFLYFHDPQRRAEWAAEGVSGGPPRPAPAQAETAAPSPVPAPVR